VHGGSPRSRNERLSRSHPDVKAARFDLADHLVAENLADHLVAENVELQAIIRDHLPADQAYELIASARAEADTLLDGHDPGV
jgi:hypothetical protein